MFHDGTKTGEDLLFPPSCIVAKHLDDIRYGGLVYNEDVYFAVKDSDLNTHWFDRILWVLRRDQWEESHPYFAENEDS